MLLEVIVALGRLRWAGVPSWLGQNLAESDTALDHAAMQALRRSTSWSAILQLLDQADGTPMRAIARHAIADQFEPKVVDGLIERLGRESTAARRLEYADALTRVCKKPDPDRAARLAVLRRMQREKVPIRLDTLGRWLEGEHQPDHVAAILAAWSDRPGAEVRRYLEAVVRDRRHSTANGRRALAIFAGGLDEDSPASLLALAQELEDGPVLADVLQRIGKYPKLPAVAVLTRKLSSPEAEVRAAAIEALGEIHATEARTPLLALLQDKDVRVRRAAAEAAGKLGMRQAIKPLLTLATDTDSAVRRACLESLRRLREPRVVPLAVAALGDHQLDSKALECLGELGGPQQARAVSECAQRNPSNEVLAAAVRVLTTWHDRKGLTAAERKGLDRAVAEVHGSTGILVRWNVRGPLSAQLAPPIIERFDSLGQGGEANGWRTRFASGAESRLLLAAKDVGKISVWLAFTDVFVPEATAVEFRAASRGSMQVWLNGQSIHRNDQARQFQIDSDRFAATLVKGVNRLLVQVGPPHAAVELQLRFRRKSSTADHERLTQAALARAGNAQRGRKLFFDVEKAQCLKCHRLGEQGERIGPELTGVASRFSRIHIVESILEPSRTIAPSFATWMLVLKNGKTLTGVKVAETERTLTLADTQGRKHPVAKTEIEQEQPSPVSIMPEGFAKRFTQDELVDLIAFLMSQKEDRSLERQQPGPDSAQTGNRKR